MNKNIFHNMEGNKVYFKKLSINDVDAMHSYVSDEDVSRFIGWPLTTTTEETKIYLEKLITRDDEGTHLYASIMNADNNTHIGSVMIFNFDHEAKHAEIGYVIHKDYWGLGMTTEAIKLMKKYCFNYLNLNKLHARIVDTNIGSCKVVEKNGFILEGRLRDFYSIEGNIYDGLIYGFLKEHS
jgi:RimJ/RimL family protein N-acetyltransferase